MKITFQGLNGHVGSSMIQHMGANSINVNECLACDILTSIIYITVFIMDINRERLYRSNPRPEYQLRGVCQVRDCRHSRL